MQYGINGAGSAAAQSSLQNYDGAKSACVERDASPIEMLLNELAATVEIGLNSCRELRARLEPVSVGQKPVGNAEKPMAVAATPIENRIYSTLEKVQRLVQEMNDARDGLRI